MSTCLFCAEESVATTATSTTMEAFPFLCAQVGLPGGGRDTPAALCSTCHAMWEEVTLLYSNVQNLLNLMARKVTTFKQKVKDSDGKQASTRQVKRARISATTAPRPEVMMNWWYPNSSAAPVAKLETVEIADDLDIGDDMDLEDVEIPPDPEVQSDGGDEAEDDEDNDPSYDTIDNTRKATTSRKSNSTREEDDAARKQDEFVAMLKNYSCLLDKSQLPAVKEKKAAASIEFIAKWKKISGQQLTVKSFFKKLNNMKTRVRERSLNLSKKGSKKGQLLTWERDLLTLMKGPNGTLVDLG